MVLHTQSRLSILFGILILVFPKFLNYLVAIYLILDLSGSEWSPFADKLASRM